MMGESAIWVYVVLASLTSLGLLYYARVSLPNELERRLEDSFHAFGTAIELRFPRLKGATERVLELCEKVGTPLRLRAGTRRQLAMAAQLRDIGLCSIPYSLLNEKPLADWTDAEMQIFYRHPEVGGAMLELVPSLRRFVPLVRCHHAPFDGSEGPLFPAGRSIPVEARILNAVTEYVDAERSFGQFLAREMLVNGSGKQFDPAVVDALLTVLRSEGVTPEHPADHPRERVS